MAEKINVCLMNDSFPPTVDGVANCVFNYATVINRALGSAVVCTPYYPNVTDSYDFPVIRYPSISMGKLVSYRAGIPFDASTLKKLRGMPIDLIHAHTPIMSCTMARTLRDAIKKPIVLTYHTKFDIEIARTIPTKSIQKAASQLLAANISGCDEVWVVSTGAGENLRKLGYQGDYVVMPNGVDLEKRRASDTEIALVNETYHIAPDETVLLFAGRILWYKGLRTIIDALHIAKAFRAKFKMLFVGDGDNKDELMAYAAQSGLSSDCIFIPAIHDREKLRAIYSRASLFLFPSDFDTNGLVVREAAASGTASVVLKDSCAAEGITDDRNGFLIDNDPADLARVIVETCACPGKAHAIGRTAMDELYLSWEDSIRHAYDRYQVVIDRYAANPGHDLSHAGDEFFHFMSLMCLGKNKKRISRKKYHRKVNKAKVYAYKRKMRRKKNNGDHSNE